MNEFWQAFESAFGLVFTFDATLIEISARSLYVTLSATFIASVIALPMAGLLMRASFPGRGFVIVMLNALMGLPPVTVGLMVYLLLSREGPFGVFGLLFTPAAMIVAQVIIIMPLIASVALEALRRHQAHLEEFLTSLNVSPAVQIMTLCREAHREILVAILAGFGRGIGEVGAIMIVGGNIDHATRVLTTAIATQTSRGDIRLALALGFVLIALSLTVNLVAHMAGKGLKGRSR